MNVSYVQTMLFGALVLLSETHGATAAPPAVQPTPLPGRNFPTEKELAKFLEPIPPPVIPDDPPPHEGAMFEYPQTIAPPDLILVEVLEALPGRPISGERLVRPDGTVSLGFYGDVHVRGLTLEQAKVRIILHLRTFLPDEVLGMFRVIETGEPPAAMPEEAGEDGAVKPSSTVPRARPSVLRRARAVSQRTRRDSRQPLTAPEDERKQNPGTHEPAQESEHSRPKLAPLESPPSGSGLMYQSIHPADSDRVFVDITGYNHNVYFVQGDVAAPGRYPFTGDDTVLDALNFAGNLIATAEPKDIRLVRPSAGGRPERTYRVDLDSILAGNAKANYQIFPGDRLIVGRNDVVKKTIEIDRLVAPFINVIDTIRRYNLMVDSVKAPGDPSKGAAALTTEQREAIIKVWVDLWAKAMSQPGGATLDEKTLRELMLKALPPVPSNERKD